MTTTFETVYETEEIVDASHRVGNREYRLHEAHVGVSQGQQRWPAQEGRRIYAMFCFEHPDSAVGRALATLAQAIARFETPVHIFARQHFNLELPGVYMHIVESEMEGPFFSQVQDFTRRACNMFLREFQDATQVTMIGYEWSSIPTISLIRAIKDVGFVLSLHSLERQRSNLSDPLSRYIEEIELAGLREARLVLCYDSATADVARRCVPECAERIEIATPMSMIQSFQFSIDPGEVKKRFQIGPIDPTLLFIGDLNENYGPDLLIKAMPKILRHNKQVRCVFIGDGDLLWPLRVHSRYMLLDYAVRLAGHLEGQPLHELIYASDIIVVPSRKATPWWPIEAAWAANRPVVATTEAAPALICPDEDAAVVKPDESSIAQGVIRILDDPDFARSIASEGRAKLEERYSINKLIARINEVMEVGQEAAIAVSV